MTAPGGRDPNSRVGYPRDGGGLSHAKGRPAVTLKLLNEQIERLLALRDDVQVVAATMLHLDNSLDRLRDELTREIVGVREEMSEIRAELRAMRRQHDRTAARVRRLEDQT
jgi:uncharacterized coiled-coil DUF342 family protein